ncbi:hypothetical protein [Streptomyces sp. 147326]|uniref:hypothetical protein n=1 Tax=Streptomyces sp. 147326 TaxID=3074379 RepID=UPI00385790C9
MTEVDRARHDLANHLAAQVRDDGSVPGPCASRVLESALLLSLLRRQRHHTTAQRSLEGFLTRDPDARTTRFDSALSDAVLAGRQSDADWVHTELLAGFDRFTFARMRELLVKLLREGQRRGVWENHVTAHLLALRAVSVFAPGSADVVSRPTRTPAPA